MNEKFTIENTAFSTWISTDLFRQKRAHRKRICEELFQWDRFADYNALKRDWNKLEQAAAEPDGRLPLETENLKQSKATENLFDTEFRRKGRLLKLKKSNDKIKKQFSYFTVCGTR